MKLHIKYMDLRSHSCPPVLEHDEIVIDETYALDGSIDTGTKYAAFGIAFYLAVMPLLQLIVCLV